MIRSACAGRDGKEASKAAAALAEAAEVGTLYYVQGGAAAWKVRLEESALVPTVFQCKHTLQPRLAQAMPLHTPHDRVQVPVAVQLVPTFCIALHVTQQHRACSATVGCCVKVPASTKVTNFRDCGPSAGGGAALEREGFRLCAAQPQVAGLRRRLRQSGRGFQGKPRSCAAPAKGRRMAEVLRFSSCSARH